MSSGKIDPEVDEKGTTLFITHSIPSSEMEKWRKVVSKRLDLKVDWYFFGGRIVVKVLGDLDVFRKDFYERGEQELFELQKKSYEKIGYPHTKLDFMWYD